MANWQKRDAAWKHSFAWVQRERHLKTLVEQINLLASFLDEKLK